MAKYVPRRGSLKPGDKRGLLWKQPITRGYPSGYHNPGISESFCSVSPEPGDVQVVLSNPGIRVSFVQASFNPGISMWFSKTGDIYSPGAARAENSVVGIAEYNT